MNYFTVADIKFLSKIPISPDKIWCGNKDNANYAQAVILVRFYLITHYVILPLSRPSINKSLVGHTFIPFCP